MKTEMTTEQTLRYRNKAMRLIRESGQLGITAGDLAECMVPLYPTTEEEITGHLAQLKANRMIYSIGDAAMESVQRWFIGDLGKEHLRKLGF